LLFSETDEEKKRKRKKRKTKDPLEKTRCSTRIRESSQAVNYAESTPHQVDDDDQESDTAIDSEAYKDAHDDDGDLESKNKEPGVFAKEDFKNVGDFVGVLGEGPNQEAELWMGRIVELNRKGPRHLKICWYDPPQLPGHVHPSEDSGIGTWTRTQDTSWNTYADVMVVCEEEGIASVQSQVRDGVIPPFVMSTKEWSAVIKEYKYMATGEQSPARKI
jgi:hypothetical protein